MITIHQCMYGLTSTKGDKVLPAKKLTTLITNMPALSVTIDKKCDGGHDHAVVE